MFELDKLTLGRAKFVMRARQGGLLQNYLGPMLRGNLGNVLRKRPEAYGYCFETRVTKDTPKLRGNEALPHPFLIEPPPPRDDEWKHGERLEFSMLFIGHGTKYFSYFVDSVVEMGELGLGFGRERVPFSLEQVQNDLGNDIGMPLWQPRYQFMPPLPVVPANTLLPYVPNPPACLHICLESPLRILKEGSLVSFGAQMPPEFHKFYVPETSFSIFANSLLMRLSSLLYFHCDTELQLDFKGIIERARSATLVMSDLHVAELSRWSSRQKQDIPLDGVVGRIAWKGDAIAELWPLLCAGALFHTGKSTVLGLGQYSLLKPVS
jgi:hypothetical protein